MSSKAKATSRPSGRRRNITLAADGAKRKIPKSGAKIIRPDDPGHHDVTFERFSAIVLKAGLEKIENTLSFKPPDDGFRIGLLRVLWRFYSNSLPEAGVMFNRKANPRRDIRMQAYRQRLPKRTANRRRGVGARSALDRIARGELRQLYNV
jgi:hypothetical protein